MRELPLDPLDPPELEDDRELLDDDPVEELELLDDVELELELLLELELDPLEELDELFVDDELLLWPAEALEEELAPVPLLPPVAPVPVGEVGAPPLPHAAEKPAAVTSTAAPDSKSRNRRRCSFWTSDVGSGVAP